MISEATDFAADHRRMLADLAERQRLRRLIPPQGVDFSSNDYLGLAGSPRIARAIRQALDRGVPTGSGGSRLLRGNHPEHELLEEEAARFFGSEAALFFASGFAANAALFATLPQRGDLVVHDELVHASAHDGMRLGRAECVAAAHNDPEAFSNVIRTWRRGGGGGRVWIALESLYSMDGDRAPLDAFRALADEHEAFLLIDEAHATGVFGPEGRGLAAHLEGLENVIVLRTCGKALGCEGALLTGPAFMRDFLINRGRGFIFSTAPSPLMASAVREALRILAGEPERRQALVARIDEAERLLGPLGAVCRGTQIVPVIVGDDARAMAAASAIQVAGYDVRGIRPPTVPAGTARLRISVTLNASLDDIAGLAATLEEVLT